MADEKQKSAAFRRHDQLKRWEDSETSKQPTVLRKKDRRVKFQDGCVFLAACSSGDIEEVTALLKRGADINTANVDGLTALHQACIDDNLDMVEFLIENGAGIDVCDNEGWTALHATASCAFCEVARFLLEYGANVAAVNNDGDLPIDIAEGEDMEELLADYMEKRQIDADSARNEEENQMLADANQWLNSRGFREKPHSKTGATALHVAAAKGYLKVMQILIMARVDIDAKDNDGWTPLHAASHWGQQEACEVLVENMCNMEARDSSGQTCFDVADDDLLKILEDLKTKQATLREDTTKELPAKDIIETKHPMKRRTSITRMSLDQKQHIILGDVHEERQKMEALMNANIPGIDEDIKEEDKKSSASSSSEESSSDSETEKQNELNKKATAKAQTQENVKENVKTPEATATQATIPTSPVAVVQPVAQKIELPQEPSKPAEVTLPSVNGEVSVTEIVETTTVTIKDETVVSESDQKSPVSPPAQTPDEGAEQTPDVTVSISLDNPPLVSTTETVKKPEVLSSEEPPTKDVAQPPKESETPATEALSATERRRQRRRQLKEEAEMLDKKYEEECKEKGEREQVLSKEEQKQTEPEKDTAEEEPATACEQLQKEPLHRTSSLPARLSNNRQAPSFSPRPISSRIETASSPASWRAGLRKTGSSSAVPDTVPLRRIGEEQVQRSASSPWLAPETKTEDLQDRPYRRSYLSSTSSIQENPPDAATTRNRHRRVETLPQICEDVIITLPSESRRRDVIDALDSDSPDENTYPYSSRPQVSTAAAMQSAYVPYSRRRQEREAERERERANAAFTSSSTLTTPSSAATTVAFSRRSYEPPKRDEETETQRKMRARRARETRRSTQGVTKEDVAAAEATLQMADSDKNGRDSSRTSSALTNKSTESSTNSKPEDTSTTYTRRRRDNTTKDEDTSNLSSSFRRSRDYTTPSTDLSSSTGYIPRSQRLSAHLTDSASLSTSLPSRSSYRRRHAAPEDVVEEKPEPVKVEEKKPEEKKEDQTDSLDPHQRRLASIRERRRERRTSALSQNTNANTKEEEAKETKPAEIKTEPEETRSSSRYSSDRYGTGERSSYSDRYASTRPSRDTDRPSSSYRYSRSSTTATPEAETQDYKKLYDEQKAENERIKKELAKVQKDCTDSKSELEKIKSSQSRLGNSLDQREKRTLERKISEMEEELKQMEILKQDNQRLKEENGALIRVISKLSK